MVSVPHLAHGVYSSFEIFEQDFQAALDSADAKFDLSYCVFSEDFDASGIYREASAGLTYQPNCVHAIRNAIETKLSYRTIIFQLAQKVIPSENWNMSELNEQIDEIADNIDPDHSIDEKTLQIIKGISSIKQKYSP